MPNIKEYNSQVEPGGPIQVRRLDGEDLGSGQALQKLGNTVAGVGEALYKRQEQDETSSATVALSNAQAELTKNLNDQIKEGTLNTDDFIQKYDDQMAELSQNYSTRGAQDFFREASTKLRGHFLESAIAGQSELAAVKTSNDLNQTLSNFTSALKSDPTGFELSKQNFESYVDSTVKSGLLPAKVAEKLKAEGRKSLAEGAVRGWIDIDPEGAKAQLHEGLWNTEMDSDKIVGLQREASMAITAKHTEAQRVKEAEKEAKKLRDNETQNQFLTLWTKGQLSTKQILNSDLPAFGSGSKDEFLRMVKTAQEKPIKTDPIAFAEAFRRIHLPDGDPQKITDENALNQYVINRSMTLESVKALRGEIQNKGTIEGQIESAQIRQIQDIAKQRLTKSNPMLGIKDPVGEANYYDWLTDFMGKYRKGRVEGKSSDSLLNPNSPDYLGKNVDAFAKSPNEIMRTTMELNRPKPKNPEDMRKDGETAAQYLERKKAKKE